MEKTIEIPEGYEARIEGNKVILEPKESEDERIRKEMVDYFSQYKEDGIRGIDITPWIAYLERQKPIYNLEIPAGDIAPAEEDGTFDEDEFLENELSAFLKNYDKEYDDDAIVSDVAKHFYEIGKKQKEHKSVQDEDEREYVSTLKSLVADFVRDKDEIDREYYQKIYDWLDGRHIEQKPAGWSREDEQIYNSFKTICEILIKNPHGEKFEADAVYAKKMFAWLKSLRPQPHWKPSEEQMNSLWQASIYYKSGKIKITGKTLESLYNDLKKL